MKTKFFIIALSAMMLFAVEGYAQRGERGEGRSRSSVQTRSSARSYSRPMQTRSSERSYSRPVQTRSSERSYSRPVQTRSSERSYSRPVQTRSSERSANRVAMPQNRSYGRRSTAERHSVAPRNRGYGAHRYASAPHRHYEPVFRHHHGYHHHHYRCHFNDWYWYSWGGYHNRFICHRLYRDRFFDNLLGYYLWGAINAPTRLDIGNFTFSRYNASLKVSNGYGVSYLELYRCQTVRYISGYTTIDVTTGNGVADIRLYDEYGNEAVYRL